MPVPLNDERPPRPRPPEKPYRAVYEPGPIREFLSSVGDGLGVVGRVTGGVLWWVLQVLSVWR